MSWPARRSRRASTVYLACAGLALTCGIEADAAPLPASPLARLVTVQPAAGGQGTSFRVRFRSEGTDVGPDPGGDSISILGPKGTRCRSNVIAGIEWEFLAGPAIIEVGPLAHRYPGIQGPITHEASERLVRSAWCPGIYTGEAYYNIPNAIARSLSPASPVELHGTFRFRVLRTR
jgi:hypothetical protein